jgi:hypothetical protein
LSAARDGHHDWGAVVAVLAALLALATVLDPGASVADADGVTYSTPDVPAGGWFARLLDRPATG